MIEDGEPDPTLEAYNMPMAALAAQLRELGRRTRPQGQDALRRAILLEAASRLESRYSYQAALERDQNRIRGLDPLGEELDEGDD